MNGNPVDHGTSHHLVPGLTWKRAFMNSMNVVTTSLRPSVESKVDSCVFTARAFHQPKDCIIISAKTPDRINLFARPYASAVSMGDE